MKNDMPEAAFRLLSTLPVRTHEQDPPPVQRRKYRPRIVTGAGRGGNNRYRIIFRGREYQSLAEALKLLKVGKPKLFQWVEEGKAVIL